jgi:ABC-type uncharacterized transport system substrate-binding protein
MLSTCAAVTVGTVRSALLMVLVLVASSVGAQPGKGARIGVVSMDTPANSPCVERLRRGLGELGYVEGNTHVLELRWAEGRSDAVPGLAADLVRLNVDLIVSAAGPAAPAVKNATSTIPIVLATSFYPVEQGLIASLRHPGGNITGVTHFTPELMAKRVQLLKELLPRASRSPCCGCPERCRISSCATWRRPPVSSAPSSRWSRCSAGKTSRRRSTPRLVVGLRRS